MSPTPEAVQVSTTTPDEATAERIAEALLERRLAACVQVVGPITSHYRWQGERHRDTEWLCLVKAARSRADDVVTAIGGLHPYDEPEVIVTPIVAGSPGYLAWVEAETT